MDMNAAVQLRTTTPATPRPAPQEQSTGPRGIRLQREITAAGDLLDERGHLQRAGWSRGARQFYQQERVQVRRQRLKEWEHTTVLTPDYAISLTLTHLGVIGAAHVEVTRLSDGEAASGMDIFVARRGVLPPSPYVGKVFEKHTRRVQFDIGPESRSVRFSFGKRLSGHIELSAPGPYDGLSVATPFDDPGFFFYEYKVPDQRATGWIDVGGDLHTLPDGETQAIMDWGRGAWPKRSRWLWGWGAGRCGGGHVSLNLGGGFGDMRAATENAIVVDGVLHKLGEVSWKYDPMRRDEPWRFEDDAGRLSLHFEPGCHHEVRTWLGIWSARLDKVFGHFSGTAVLDDGTRLQLDDIPGFAEEMSQRW